MDKILILFNYTIDRKNSTIYNKYDNWNGVLYMEQ